ncbi:A24 family peptidase [Acidocella sp.]|jgi:prepilin peptidase CpaA|uniref:A24 family peptidase n=1 Tax=Acidocella sp. TaxID=50710 RepID=UPI002F40511A
MPVFMILSAALLIYAALHDVAVRTVPNWLPLCLLLLGCGARLVDHSLLAGAAVALVTFVVLFGAWLGGVMGGGDVKLWVATALLIPPLLQPELAFLCRVLLFGGVLAALYLALRRLVPRPRASRQGGLLRRIIRAEAWRIGRRAPLPYACAIAGGALATLLPLSFSVR